MTLRPKWTSRRSASAIASGMRCTPSRAVYPSTPSGARRRCATENAARKNPSRAETERGVLAEARVHFVAEADRGLPEPEAREPFVHRDVMLRESGVEPFAGRRQGVLADRKHPLTRPRHELPFLGGERVPWVIGPLGLPDQLSVQHQLLLAKEREHRGHVDELDPQPLGSADDPAVARADVGAPRLLAVAEAAHRVDTAAPPRSCASTTCTSAP